MVSKILSQLSASVHRDFSFDRPAGRYEASHYCLLAALALVAFYLRILNLGVPGLSGDEDIMGLAVRGLHESGQPLLPSGMEYRRAILHTYILYCSTLLFGQTEWALRIPSVIAGMLLLVYVFRIGKRFLDPVTNVAAFSLFALAVPLIEISRTARMYVFLVLLLAVFIHYIFKWEDEENDANPFFALFFLTIAMTFHPLAIFALPVFFWPALSARSTRRLWLAIAACIPFLAFYWYFGKWFGAPYPSIEERPFYIEADSSSLKYVNAGSLDWLRWAFSILAIIWIAWVARRHFAFLKNLRVAMLACGLALVISRYYLPGAYVILIGALWKRSVDEIIDRPLAIVGCIALLLFTADLANSIAQAGINRVALRLTFEQASPFFWIRAIETFPISVLVLVTMTPLLVMKWRKTVIAPGFVLLAFFALICPMFAMSTFKWDFESRYLFTFMPMLFIIAAAILQELGFERMADISANKKRTAVLIVTSIMILSMQPHALLDYAKGDTSSLPDHRSTAKFVSQRPDFEQGIIIAEDSIATLYYLGRLDYRLQYGPQAAAHARIRESRIEDQYTGAAIIGSGQELRKVLCASSRPIYIIGEGQVSEKLRRRNRDGGIAEVLNNPSVESIYEVNQGPVKVWRSQGVCPRL